MTVYTVNTYYTINESRHPFKGVYNYNMQSRIRDRNRISECYMKLAIL